MIETQDSDEYSVSYRLAEFPGRAEPCAHVENVIEVTEAAETDALDDGVTLEQTGSGYAFDSEAGTNVRLAGDENAELVLTSIYGEVSVDVGANAAPEASEDLVTIEGDAGQTIAPDAHEDGSVQVGTVIDTEDSAPSYDFGFDSGEGSSIQLLPNGGAHLVGADGGFLAAAAPAWAFDAQGEPVPTWYEANGSTLTQVVDHTSGDFAYPIVADPWIGMNLFQWITVDTYSGQPRVNLKPSAWGITVWTGLAQGGGAAAFAAGQAILNTPGWDEAWN